MNDKQKELLYTLFRNTIDLSCYMCSEHNADGEEEMKKAEDMLQQIKTAFNFDIDEYEKEQEEKANDKWQEERKNAKIGKPIPIKKFLEG